jgi:hypothetical protein
VLRLARSMNSLLSGKVGGVAAIIHWIVQYALDYPVSQSHSRQWSAAQSVRDAWPAPTVTRPHRTVWCAKETVAATVGFARKERRLCNVHCAVVHRTVRCTHGQKATIAYQMELQQLLIVVTPPCCVRVLVLVLCAC